MKKLLRVALATLLLITLATPAISARDTSEELRTINGTLQQILRALAEQNRQMASRDESRMLLQRLDIQADRLIPLEDEVTQLRMRRAELEQALAVSLEKEQQYKDQADRSELGALLVSQSKGERRQQDTLQGQLNSLDTRLRDAEGELLLERQKFDDLADRIDRRLGVGGR